MRKYLTMLLVVGVILTTVISGSVFAADGDVIGYEWNGTGTGWAFAESTLDFTSEDITKDAAGFTLPTGYKSKIVLFNTVTDWSDSYNFSFDVKMADIMQAVKRQFSLTVKTREQIMSLNFQHQVILIHT
jgi:hypothetical protein